MFRFLKLMYLSPLCFVACVLDSAPRNLEISEIEELSGQQANQLPLDSCVASDFESCAEKPCDAGLYCVAHSSYDYPRCMPAAEAVSTRRCAYGSGDFALDFSAENLGVADSTQAYVAVLGADYPSQSAERAPRIVASAAVYNNAVSSLNCASVLNERYDYPRTALWLDVDDDGLCNEANDKIIAPGLTTYGWADDVNVSYLEDTVASGNMDHVVNCAMFNQAILNDAAGIGEVGQSCGAAGDEALASPWSCQSRGGFSTSVSVSGFSELPETFMYAAAIDSVFDEVLSATPLGRVSGGGDGFFIGGCDALSEQYNYPAIDVWIDLDGNAACDAALDYVGRTIYYGWDEDVRLEIRPEQTQYYAGDCASFE